MSSSEFTQSFEDQEFATSRAEDSFGIACSGPLVCGPFPHNHCAECVRFAHQDASQEILFDAPRKEFAST
jgi:hypothetical protein